MRILWDTHELTCLFECCKLYYLQYQEVALNNMQTQTNRQTASQITNKQAPHDRTQTKLQCNGCLSASSTRVSSTRAYGGRTPIGRIANWKGGDARKAADLLTSCNSSFVLPGPAAPPNLQTNIQTHQTRGERGSGQTTASGQATCDITRTVG